MNKESLIIKENMKNKEIRKNYKREKMKNMKNKLEIQNQIYMKRKKN